MVARACVRVVYVLDIGLPAPVSVAAPAPTHISSAKSKLQRLEIQNLQRFSENSIPTERKLWIERNEVWQIR